MIAGGGTGGHVYPAIATMEALRKRVPVEFLYVGGFGGIETRIVPELRIPLKTIWVSGFQRFATWRNLLFPVKLLVSLVHSVFIVASFRPRLAVGTGGYVSGPVLFVAALLGIPVVIQEQDVYPGVTTRLLARFATKICLAYEGARSYLSDFENKIVVTGNPVRQELAVYSPEEAKRKWGFAPDAPVLFVFGGSQGAQSINEAVSRIAGALLEETDVQIIWQTGEKNYNQVIAQGKWDEHRVRIVPYLKEIGLAYSAADLILSRAGAITLAELAVVAKPAILVPFPHAAGQHQLHNAEWIARQGAARVVREGPGWQIELKQVLSDLLKDRASQLRMQEAWRKIATPDASERIATEILKLLNRAETEEAAK